MWLDVNSESCYWLQCLCGFLVQNKSLVAMFCSVCIAKSAGKLGWVFMCSCL